MVAKLCRIHASVDSTTMEYKYPASLRAHNLRFATQNVVVRMTVLQIGAGLLRQSVKVSELRAWWSRMWAGWWWIAAFILCSVYTGNLVAVLTVPAYPRLINTVEELAESSLR